MRDAILHYLSRTGYTRIEPRAALFDMDGTLYDSMPHHADAWLEMTRQIGLQADRDEFFLYEGRTGASTINILMQRAYGRDATDEEVRRLYGIKSDLFRAMPPVDPMPGAAQLLREVMDAGLTRVLVTGSGQNTLISRLDADFPGAFQADMRITAANTEHSKPHPDPYLKAMALAGAEPWQSIAFENAPMGVESASRSGAFTIAIATG
ncbi:MAG: HAD family phosphatase, partial [Muribaculaceae bacterium]|nr:HAD family phosphatase [Muribaculaceae bacterium]